ncbi:toxin YdaT family protein [Klebsiella pneumoniae]|uniref:toxin YdaT family protein n=1 Tax=Klebsiella pneumoniae TaxID=573 RepID=UPI0010D464E2|nr:toxin YdaT family protein [Klebsiella pneumoniae]VFZ07851.1 Protein of uncharacterised function (DUF1019) [Klebsiella pneumoniae]
MENIEELKREIFSWAAESGQELVAIEISRMWFRLGGNTGVLKLHQIEDADGKADWRAINNNRQQIFRWLRGETKAARTKTQALAKAMEAALPAECEEGIYLILTGIKGIKRKQLGLHYVKANCWSMPI